MLAKITLVVVLLAGVSLFAMDASQSSRNAAAQAEASETRPIPAFAQQVNAQIAAVEKMAGPNAPKTAVEGSGLSIRSVGFAFPGADHAFPAGDGAELVTNNCTSCHSQGMILTQPKLSPAAWTGEVQKMQHTYKAPVADADVPAIVAYLSTLPRPGQETKSE